MGSGNGPNRNKILFVKCKNCNDIFKKVVRMTVRETSYCENCKTVRDRKRQLLRKEKYK